jgi:hypothetical protein
MLGDEDGRDSRRHERRGLAEAPGGEGVGEEHDTVKAWSRKAETFCSWPASQFLVVRRICISAVLL